MVDQFECDLVDKLEDKMAVQRFEDFIKSKQYDTDTLQDDMALFEDEGLSNLSIEFVNDQELLNELRSTMRHQRVSSRSFSTGILFWYWPWYKEQGVEEKVQRESGFGGAYHRMDFGGYSVRETVVEPKYKDLKEELLASGHITNRMVNERIMKKADDFMISNKVKALKSQCSKDSIVPFRVVKETWSAMNSVYHLQVTVSFE